MIPKIQAVLGTYPDIAAIENSTDPDQLDFLRSKSAPFSIQTINRACNRNGWKLEIMAYSFINFLPAIVATKR